MLFLTISRASLIISVQMGQYDTAQICLNGHAINAYAASHPVHNAAYCKKCGRETIMACQHCKARIPGKFRSEGSLDATKFKVPSYCQSCGRAYPWTAAALEAARLLTDEVEGLSDEDREQLKQTFPQLIVDGPETVLAATRLKKLSAKAGRAFVEGLRQLFVDVASETAKKIMTGP